ncbi:MAG: EutN/CcmL family microcompartment protein [Chloroflexi bacterium]|nr:EutN/CcmL family microcompartment protein [Chloroflexota bacterium]
MLICRVTGAVVSTVKNDSLKGTKLLIVEELSYRDGDHKRSFVAVDTVGAGEGEIVLVATGSAARETPRTRGLSIDAAILGIVDSTQTGGDTESPEDMAQATGTR